MKHMTKKQKTHTSTHVELWWQNDWCRDSMIDTFDVIDISYQHIHFVKTPRAFNLKLLGVGVTIFW